MSKFKLLYVSILALLCSGPALANDGVYLRQITETVEACAKLCNTDKDNICRGYSFCDQTLSILRPFYQI